MRKRHLFVLLSGMACAASASTVRADDAMIFPGISCVFYGKQASDVYFSPSGSTNAITNTSASSRYVVCPIIRPQEYGGIEYAEMNVQGDVTCSLYVRNLWGESSTVYSRDDVYTGWGSGGRTYTWASGGTYIAVGGSQTYAFYCSVPASGVILNYHVTADN